MKSHEIESTYSHYYTAGEKILPERLARLGYRFTARFISVVGGYKLFELLPLQSDRPADVCFLSLRHNARGVIVPAPFSEHKAMLMSATSGIPWQKPELYPDKN